MITFIKGLVGLAWLGVVVWCVCIFARMVMNVTEVPSPFTEQGMEWHRTHNPEFIKAEALQKLARLKELEMQEEAKRREQDQ